MLSSVADILNGDATLIINAWLGIAPSENFEPFVPIEKQPEWVRERYVPREFRRRKNKLLREEAYEKAERSHDRNEPYRDPRKYRYYTKPYYY
tara:strand:- start:487 stop:765 length:279 start_codon:yes stop_codon:yes gene_type:complete